MNINHRMGKRIISDPIFSDNSAGPWTAILLPSSVLLHQYRPGVDMKVIHFIISSALIYAMTNPCQIVKY